MNSNDRDMFKIGKYIPRQYPMRNVHVSFSDLDKEQPIKLD